MLKARQKVDEFWPGDVRAKCNDGGFCSLRDDQGELIFLEKDSTEMTDRNYFFPNSIGRNESNFQRLARDSRQFAYRISERHL